MLFSIKGFLSGPVSYPTRLQTMIFSDFSKFKEVLDSYNYVNDIPTFPPTVYVSPCTSSKETFSAVAISHSGECCWFSASALSALTSAGDESVDFQKALRDFKSSFQSLYDDWQAIDLDSGGAALKIPTSVQTDRNTAAMVDTYFICDPSAKQQIVTFEPNFVFSGGQAVLLQRTSFRGAKTFDAEILNGKAQTSFEVRLVSNAHLTSLQEWGCKSNMLVFRSPGTPIHSSLLFRAYSSGESWENIARALTGEDGSSEESEGSDGDWKPGDSEEEEEEEDSEDEDEDMEEDLLECLR